jgi:hypothetical protein
MIKHGLQLKQKQGINHHFWRTKEILAPVEQQMISYTSPTSI